MQHNNDTNDAVQQKMQTLRNLLATGKKNAEIILVPFHIVVLFHILDID